MKGILFIALLLGLGGVSAAPKQAPLPQWNEDDKLRLKAGELIVGRALLTKDGLAKSEEPQPVEVVIEAVEEQPSRSEDQKLGKDSAITGVHLSRYFSRRPETNLVDPQELLSMQERADLKHALMEHLEESEVPIFVYLFDSDQKVPKHYSPRSVYDSLFLENKEPIVVVYYFLGAPQRSNFLLAGGAGDNVPDWQVRELLWNAAYKAKEKSDIFDQLGDFVGQLSMRLFWLEEMMLEMTQEAEVVDPVQTEKKEDPRKQKILGFWEDFVKHQLLKVVIAVSCGAALLLLIIYFTLRRRYYFPEQPSPSRLGATIGGSYGGVLSYRAQSVPPSEQKKQFRSDFF